MTEPTAPAETSDRAMRPVAEPQDPRLAAHLVDFPGLFPPETYLCHELLDRYALAWAEELLGRLGLRPGLVQPRTLRELLAERGFIPSFAAPLAWILDRLADAGMLTIGGAEERCYRLAQPTLGLDRNTLRAQTLAIDARHTPTLDLFDAAAEAYTEIAIGKVGAAEAVLGPSRIGLWLRYFDNDNPDYAIGNQVAAIVAADRLAELGDRPWRVLEVGAGAGSASHALLDLLARRGQLDRLSAYRATEPGQFFRRRAERALRERFPQAPLSFGALDIDGDWAAQGAEPGGFDLVFGVNVLHVARRLDRTLASAHASLASGGWLVAGECLRPFADVPTATELAFRLLPGYHAVEIDPDLRPSAGFLTPEHWQRALTAAGFTEVRIAPDVAAIREIYPRFTVGAVIGRRLDVVSS